MLTAAIIYVQGSGGNLLSRSLTLCESTIPYTPEEYALVQHEMQATPEQRYNWYNNWNSSNWVTTEKELALWYHRGINEFVKYESSTLKLIDQFHPEQFAHADDTQNLWLEGNAWKNHVFIEWKNPESLKQITELARIKRPDLDHQSQIAKEVVTFTRLLHSKKQNSYSIFWEDMLELESYIHAFVELSEKLDINPHIDLVTQLYNQWKISTEQILYAKTN